MSTQDQAPQRITPENPPQWAQEAAREFASQYFHETAEVRANILAAIITKHAPASPPQGEGALRDRLAGAAIEDGNDDNLAIVLCSYFSEHPARPDDDKDDPELSWGKWVLAKQEQALDRICRALAATHSAPGEPPYTPEELAALKHPKAGTTVRGWTFHPSRDVAGKAHPEFWENEETEERCYADQPPTPSQKIRLPYAD